MSSMSVSHAAPGPAAPLPTAAGATGPGLAVRLNAGGPASAAQERFDRLMHAGFFTVWLASLVRYLAWCGIVASAIPRVGFAILFALVYLSGVLVWRRPGRARYVWLAAVVVTWTALTVTTPSFSWCAVPLFFLALRVLTIRAAVVVVAYLAVVAAVVGEIHARKTWDPSPLLAPVAIAVMSMINNRQLHRENTRRQALIDDLLRTQEALAGSERAAGVLQERIRLSREIHDTLAQGLSSMHMLLNAADQEWATAPEQARAHVRQAAAAARENLAEARRFVRDLAPPALDDYTLAGAIQRLCADTERPGLTVTFRAVGEPYALGVDVEIALLRVVQGALANVVQHAGATTVVVTLTFLPDVVNLDVCDDGVGFDPAAPRVAPDRGFGLPAIRQRVAALGGNVAVESAPGEGTVIAVSVPVLDPADDDRQPLNRQAGDEQPGDRQPDGRQPRESSTGDRQPGDPGPGESSTGGRRTREPATGGRR
ncbi:sensor histidine kinase [Planotetraspora sp. GP83]|uniref:sensor histidine kinase n=1 Tax=Planotetraspora sp. GP83 TaxID=3156264 RepID=UPI0035154FC4